MYGQMTAGSWIYIGTQGIVQGTYETFFAVAISTSTARLRALDPHRRPGRHGRRPALAATWPAFSMIAVGVRRRDPHRFSFEDPLRRQEGS